MAGVVRRDVGLYKHLTGCEHTCSLGQEKMRKSQRHMKPLPSERQEAEKKQCLWLKESDLEFVNLMGSL